MKILRYEEYIMEKLTSVGDFLHIDKSGIIYVDSDIIGEYFSFIPQFAEIAINENPDKPELGWNYELSIGIKDELNVEHLQAKIEIMKQDFSEYIKDVLIIGDTLIIKFVKGLKVKTNF